MTSGMAQNDSKYSYSGLSVKPLDSSSSFKYQRMIERRVINYGSISRVQTDRQNYQLHAWKTQLSEMYCMNERSIKMDPLFRVSRPRENTVLEMWSYQRWSELSDEHWYVGKGKYASFRAGSSEKRFDDVYRFRRGQNVLSWFCLPKRE